MNYSSFLFPPTLFFLTTYCIYFNGLRMFTFKVFNRDCKFHCQVCSRTQLCNYAGSQTDSGNFRVEGDSELTYSYSSSIESLTNGI